MKQKGFVKLFQFDSFKEMIDFLKDNPNGTRKVKYQVGGSLFQDEIDKNEFYLDVLHEGVTSFIEEEYIDEQTGELNEELIAQDYDLCDFTGEEIVVEADGTLYVTLIHDQDSESYDVSLYHDKENALKCVKDDLKMRFGKSEEDEDEDEESDYTEDELLMLQQSAVDSIKQSGYYSDDSVTYDVFSVKFGD